MLQKIATMIGDLVLSKNDCGYQDVIGCIPTAQTVSVVTYNISKDEEGLLDVLRGCEAQVRLITNIPGRFDTYTSPHARGRAAQTIDRMFRKLDPETFGALTKIFFCFRNHAKIIMTESVAYVGSANYSEESVLSWESGIIIRDREVIKQLTLSVDQIELDSVRYYGPKMLKAITARQRLLEFVLSIATVPCSSGCG